MNEFQEGELLKIFFEESPDALFLINTGDYSIEMCNNSAVRLFEMDSKENFIAKYGHHYHVEEHTDQDIALVNETLAQGLVYRNEYEYRTDKGNTFWAIFETKTVILRNQTYQYIRLIDISKDKLMRTIEEVKLRNLIQEANHRIKNNLTSILALVFLEIGDSNNATDQKLREIHARITAVALLHEKLNTSENSNIKVRQYLFEIVEKALVLHPKKDLLKLKVDIDDLELANEIALNLGLITSELISNSIKHAFNPDEKNYIDLKLKDIKTHRLYCYLDNGMSKGPIKNKGLGTEILSILSAQIGGKMEYVNNALNLSF